MRITFEGREWEYDLDQLDVRQAMVLHMTHGLTIKAWSDGFTELDQRCYHFAYWHMLQQNGVVKPIGDCNPNIIDFIVAYQEARSAADAEEEKAAEPDPTVPPPSPTGSAASPAWSTPRDTSPPYLPQEGVPTAS